MLTINKWLASAACVVLLVSIVVGTPVAAAAGWTFGPEYLAYTETYEHGNRWYESHVYWRAAYFNGTYQFAEFVRRVDYYRGPIISYGPAQVDSQLLEYVNPPHLSLVTTYHRPVYRYGLPDGCEPMPGLTTIEDACQVSEGERYAQTATVMQTATGPVLRVVYIYPIYHANPRYGRFLVGQRESVELTPISTSPSTTSTATPQVPLDTALRQIGTVADFSDYLLVAQSTFAQDIHEAFELGLVVGRYDEHQRYYAPESLITLGEMVNILARNYGADTSTQGDAAAVFLQDLGVAVPSGLGAPLTLSQLTSLAAQLSTVDTVARADLLVMRQVLDGVLEPDEGTGITRAHAVAMFRPTDAGVDATSLTVTSLPQIYDPVPSDQVPPRQITPTLSTNQIGDEDDPALPELLFVLVD